MDKRQQITKRASGILRRVGFIPAGYARLGRGDGQGIILADEARRVAYIFDSGQVTATAVLADNINPSAINKPEYEGKRVKLAYPPNENRIHIIGFDTGEGYAALGGRTPNEQYNDGLMWMTVNNILNFRLSPNDPEDMQVYVQAGAYYDASGNWGWFGGDALDLEADITALASGEHQMALIYHDISTNELGRLLNTAEAGGANDKDVFDAATILDMGLTSTQRPVGAVHLYDTQTLITEDDIYRSWDPRALFGSGGVGALSRDDIEEMIWLGVS
jgi:hypothetical protein